MPEKTDHFILFQQDVNNYSLPEKFTFPFYYDPHPLCEVATKELQQYLEEQTDFDHNFGLDPTKVGTAIGKMFGVLVVKNRANRLGYLAAFSGKLAEKNHHRKFVPPVFDMLTDNSRFQEEIVMLNELTQQIEASESAKAFIEAKEKLNQTEALAKKAVNDCKQKIRTNKKLRKHQRQEAESNLAEQDFLELKEQLRKQSIKEQYFLKDLNNQWQRRIVWANHQLKQLADEIEVLKQRRKQQSANLQKWLFEQYRFLNQYGQAKDLTNIFDEQPPAGAGECAAPKLLQYAFLHQLQPIAMAEFWWGASPKSEVRRHRQFYPACRGKCQPILAHMLEGIETDPNPMLQNHGEQKTIEVLFEDKHLLVIHKPVELLSVPGKNVKDSVQYRLKKRYPEATGSLIVHRLDMSTSGLMLIAKDEAIHRHLQRQFIKKYIKKRYVALLDGDIEDEEGTIDLPLRVDLDDRPRQLVCYDYGKAARTHWKVVAREKGKTLIHFFPITGRTHQLRVHAAHHKGLNAPIMGDDLYGTKADRLYLHAEWIFFTHPVSKEKMEFEWKAEFS